VSHVAHRLLVVDGARPLVRRRNTPFGDVVAWVNVELTKNAAEIGYARFLYAVGAYPDPGAPPFIARPPASQPK
jgi:NADPH-dependent 2,4-dienoyl-CoA reductase/sulfur reductase-like enzyme